MPRPRSSCSTCSQMWSEGYGSRHVRRSRCRSAGRADVPRVRQRVARSPPGGGTRRETIVDLRWSLSNELLRFAAHLLSEITVQEVDRYKDGFRPGAARDPRRGRPPIGEALALRWQHVDLGTGTLHVVDAKTPKGIR